MLNVHSLACTRAHIPVHGSQAEPQKPSSSARAQTKRALYTSIERDILLGRTFKIKQQLDPGSGAEVAAMLTKLQNIQDDLRLLADDSDPTSDSDYGWLRAQEDILKASTAKAQSGAPSLKVTGLVNAFLDCWEIARPPADAPTLLVREVTAIVAALDPKYVQLDREYAQLAQTASKQQAKMSATQYPEFKARLDGKRQLHKEMAEKEMQRSATLAGQVVVMVEEVKLAAGVELQGLQDSY